MSTRAATVRTAAREHTGLPPSWRRLAVLGAFELGRQRRVPLVWGLPLGLMSVFVVLLYPSIADSLQELTRQYPPGLKEAFGVTDLGSLPAYLHTEMYSMVIPIAMAVLGIRTTAAALAGAERSGTLDLLLTTPVSRPAVAAAAYAGSLLTAALTLAVVWALTFSSALIAGADLPLGRSLAGAAGAWSLAAFFVGAGLLSAAAAHNAGRATWVATVVLAAMYLLDVLGGASELVEPFQVLSAFHLAGAPLRDGLDWSAFFGLAGAGAVLAAAALPVFARRGLTGR